MGEQAPSTRDIAALIVAALALVGLAATERYSFLLFHSLAEVFSVVVACGIFMVAWNARRFAPNAYLIFIGIAFLFVGVVDLIHTLAYKDMGVFKGYGANLPTQLWIGARYLHSVSLLVAALLVRRKLKAPLVFGCYGAAVLALFLSIFYWDVFPDCFVENKGLTAFKKVSEYAICLVLLASMVLLLCRRSEFDAHVLRLLVVSIAFTIASELAFTFYISVYDAVNMLGHLLKIVAFFLIYKAVIETSLVRPYNTLFRELKQSEEALRVSEIRFRSMIDESPDGMVVVNRQGIVRYTNPAADALLGAKPKELIGAPFGFPIEAGRTTELDIARGDAERVRARMRVVKTTWEGEPSYLASLHDISDHTGAAGAGAGGPDPTR